MQLQCVAVEPVSLQSGVSKTATDGKQKGALVSPSGSGGAIVDLVFGAELVEVTRDGRVRVKVADATGFEPGGQFALVPVAVEEEAPVEATPAEPETATTTEATPAA